jgi:hypothetical protein
MKCLKCKNDLQEADKFCPQCGEKTIEKEEDLIELVRKSFGTWFTIGREYGNLEGKNDKKGVEDFVENIKKSEISEFFSEALAFSKTHSVTKFNEEGQKGLQKSKAQ